MNRAQYKGRSPGREPIRGSFVAISAVNRGGVKAEKSRQLREAVIIYEADFSQDVSVCFTVKSPGNCSIATAVIVSLPRGY